MTLRTAERRRSVRVAQAYPVTVRNKRGHILLDGRTANVSEGGVFAVGRSTKAFSIGLEIYLELTVPAISASTQRRAGSRQVRYRGRIIRCQSVGQLFGIGIQFLEKLP